ncbi:CnrY/NccY family anti-sigma factor [Luteibacter aegosomatissinici]|uniref:CnrY/NccY family anti-sigma factor n=1 Tax=Luteibacter aegosomatissinici TaxID=2911539 RepID=UPI001FF710D5|nr:CnrY/NccY family anti-sigma factor [Luteibacter aegosomatissinici]UPG94302.1 CnrY/NccY family anti-sigma factor [Luteibacter aegosomatissinici]
MNSVDQWLANASRVTHPTQPVQGEEMALMERLAHERTPAAWASRREARRAVLCAAMAAVITFGGAGWLARAEFAPERPTWVAAPSALSPYALLVGR